MVAILAVGCTDGLAPAAGPPTVAFVDPVYAGGSAGLATNQLFVAPAGGGTAEPVTRSAGHKFWPRWSPNGAQILYLAGTRNYILDLATGVESAALPDSLQMASPFWSPDGNALAFERWNAAQLTSEGMTLDLRTGAIRSFGPVRPLAWSPDGRELLAIRDGELVAAMVVGTGTRQIAVRASLQIWLGPAAWSPDGTRIVIPRGTSLPSAFIVETVVLDATTGAILAVVPSADWPSWSPDGRHIAFLDEFYRLGVVRSDGTGRRVSARLTSTGYVPSWSRDGEDIAAREDNGARGNLVLVRAATLQTGVVLVVNGGFDAVFRPR